GEGAKAGGKSKRRRGAGKPRGPARQSRSGPPLLPGATSGGGGSRHSTRRGGSSSMRPIPERDGDPAALAADPHDVNNLATDPKYKATLEAMRKRLADWEEATGDKGRTPEPAAMYDSDMKVYLGGGKKDND